MDCAQKKARVARTARLVAITIGFLAQASFTKVIAQLGPPGSLVGSLSEDNSERQVQQNTYTLGYRRGRADQRRADRVPGFATKAPSTAAYGGEKDDATEVPP